MTISLYGQPPVRAEEVRAFIGQIELRFDGTAYQFVTNEAGMFIAGPKLSDIGQSWSGFLGALGGRARAQLSQAQSQEKR